MAESKCAGRLTAAGLAVVLLAGCAHGGKGDPRAPDTVKARAAQTVPFTLQNTGSDTLVNLALAWAERYMAGHPAVRISVTGGGSGTGIASLINGTIQIANASREMSQEEIAAAKKNGITPVRFTVALDAIAVVENPNNPVTGLTLSQVSDLYTGQAQDMEPGRGREPTGSPPLARIQLRHVCLFPGTGRETGEPEGRGALLPGDPPHAVLGGHHD